MRCSAIRREKGVFRASVLLRKLRCDPVRRNRFASFSAPAPLPLMPFLVFLFAPRQPRLGGYKFAVGSLVPKKKFAPTEAHRRWCRAVVLWTAGATAEKETACIVTLRRAGLHALAFCRRGYQRGVPFGASLATFCASRKSPAPESGTHLLQKEAAYAASFLRFFSRASRLQGSRHPR